MYVNARGVFKKLPLYEIISRDLNAYGAIQTH